MYDIYVKQKLLDFLGVYRGYVDSSHLILSHFISNFDLMDFFFSSIYSFLHLDFSTKIFVLIFFCCLFS